MPLPHQRGDFHLANSEANAASKPFMLVRGQGRAWSRTGVPDIPSRRSQSDVAYGNVSDVIDHPEVWDDWSGGFGEAYRRPERRNTIHWSRGFDGRFPNQLIHSQAPQLLPARYASTRENGDFFLDVPLPGVGAPPAGAGAVLVLGRGYVASYVPTEFPNTAGSAFDRIYEATGGGALSFGHRPALFGSFTYIPNTNGSSFYQRAHSGTDYTQGPNQPARWFDVAAGRMWFLSDNHHRVRSVAIEADALATANYAATLALGNGFMRSEDAYRMENQLYVGFPDGVYQGNLSGTFNNVLADLGELIDVDNARDLTVHGGFVVAAQGPHIWAFHPGDISEVREIGPTGHGSNRSQVKGRFTTLQGYGKWLYAGLFTGSLSYFLAGRDASYPLPYVWQPLHDFLGLTCKVNRIHVDAISSTSGNVQIPNRIWCATEASFGAQAGATAPVFWWPIPRGDDNPLNDLTFSPNYLGSGRLDVGSSDWGAPGTPRVFRKIDLWANSFASGAQYGDIFYTVDDGARATLGRAQVSPFSELYFPGVSGSFVLGRTIALSMESFTASVNTTPVYRAIVNRGTMRPRSFDMIGARVRIADGLEDRQGGPMRPGAVMLRELREMAEGSAPSFLTDLTGAVAWVAVQAPIEEQEVYQQDNEEPEIMATVQMALLDFTTAPAPLPGQFGGVIRGFGFGT